MSRSPLFSCWKMLGLLVGGRALLQSLACMRVLVANPTGRWQKPATRAGQGLRLSLGSGVHGVFANRPEHETPP